jgi:hypothetical protein
VKPRQGKAMARQRIEASQREEGGGRICLYRGRGLRCNAQTAAVMEYES